jgi:beta-glucosidase
MIITGTRLVLGIALAAATWIVTPTGGEPQTEHFRFPENFLWGSATAAHQVEGGNHFSDWWQWEQALHAAGVLQESSDDGPDFLSHYPADLAAAAAMGHTAFRFSIEWARVEKQPGVWDEAEIARYAAILDECRRNGLEPVVTLNHFTLPVWVQSIVAPESGLGGWHGPAGAAPGQAPVVGLFARYAREMAARFGHRVAWWITLNEPMVLLFTGYVSGQRPPGHVQDFANFRRAYGNLLAAHAVAASAIRSVNHSAHVSVAQNQAVFVPSDGSAAAIAAAIQLAYIWNDAFLDAVVRGDVDANFDGDYDDPGEGRGIVVLRRSADYVALNYYTRFVVVPLDPPIEAEGIRLLGVPVNDPTGDHNDLGWRIYPEGLYERLIALKQRYPGVPILITENGIAEAAVPDVKRPEFILGHLRAIAAAIARGALVRGYLHWALMDNFEWESGFRPRFGLLRVDYTQSDRPRSRTRGADTLAAVIAAGRVMDEMEAARVETSSR